METRPSYVLVGTFLLGLIATGIVFVLWIAGQRDTANAIPLSIHFTGEVTGLTQGSTVRYRGIPVGKVTRVRIDPTNPDIIEVSVEVEPNTPIWTDTVARIETPGLTGSPFVQLLRPTPDRPRTGPAPTLLSARELRRRDEPYVIQGQPTELQQIFEEVPKAVAAITKLATQATVLVDRASAVLDDDNRRQFAKILDNFESASANIRTVTDNANKLLGKENQDRVASILKQADDATSNLRTATADAQRIINQDIGSAARKLDPAVERITAAISNVEKSAKSFGEMSDQVTALVRENRQPIKTFTSTGLYEFNQFLADFRKLINSTERLVRRMENDPSSFFFGNRRGYSPRGR